MIESSEFFYNNENGKESLNKRISINDNNLKFAIEKKNDLLTFLKPRLKEAIGYEVKHWIQGSYKNHTLIRPTTKFDEFDIDVGIYIFCNAEDESLDAKEIKNLNRDIINEFAENDIGAKLIERKPNCERIAYESIFHIDIPIYYYDEEKKFTRLATENKGWIDSDPKALQDWFEEKVFNLTKDQLARLRRIIKYVKTWVSLKWNKLDEGIISSLAITILVTNYYIDEVNDESTFISTFKNINRHLKNDFRVLSPLNNDDLLELTNAQIEIAKNKFNILENICNIVKVEENIFKKYFLWNSIFEHMFPSYSGMSEIESASNTNLPALSTPPKIIVNQYDKDKKKRKIIINQNVIAFKKDFLYFSIDNKFDYPDTVKVRWTVRNNGEEACKINDLGHSLNYSLDNVFLENCEYNGSHFMDCIILDQYYNILGFNTIKVNINGFYRPKRNSIKKRHGAK